MKKFIYPALKALLALFGVSIIFIAGVSGWILPLVYGLVSQGILVGWFFFVLARRWTTQMRVRFGIAIATLLLTLIPFGEYSLAMILRGVWNDPSPPLLALLIYNMRFPQTQIPIARPLVIIFVLVGAALYITALAPAVPPSLYFYKYGMAASSMRYTVLALLLWAAWYGQRLVLRLLLIALVAYAVKVMESDNLWDYLIDPILWVAALVWLAKYRRTGEHRWRYCGASDAKSVQIGIRKSESPRR